MKRPGGVFRPIDSGVCPHVLAAWFLLNTCSCLSTPIAAELVGLFLGFSMDNSVLAVRDPF
jgi:hypothetical protein